MEEFLTFATRGLLGLIATLAVIEFLRYRDRPRLDIALMLASLGVPVLIAAAGLNEIRVFQAASGMAVVSQPYLLLRLVEDFRPVPRIIMIAGAAGMVLSWAPLILIEPELPPPVVLAIIVYFLVFEGYAAAAFVLGARATRGVSRWRHGLAAAGSAMLAATILLIGVNVAAPNLAREVNLVRGGLPILAGLAYYLAFITPAWLRQAWQLPEVRSFLRTVAGQPARERADRLLRELCAVGSRATGGEPSAVFLWDPDKHVFSAAHSDTPALRSLVLAPEEAPLVTEAWEENRSMQIKAASLGLGGRRLAQSAGALALLAVPLATLRRSWGVLLVPQQRGSLFPSDDLGLLDILAEQCAVALDNAELVAEHERRAEEEHRLVAQLETANRELEAFAYSVSHDLRAPLRGIDGFSHALMKEYGDALGGRGLHYLERVRANSQLMERLIDDLLRLSRVTRLPLTLQEVDLSAMAKSIEERLQRQERGRKVRFQVQEGVKARGDPGLLEVAMENLLGNAWKFTSQHPTATIEFGVSCDDDTPVYFVKDDGAGFEMEYVDKLFGPFQRLHVDQEFDGNGIGLATVQRIIARHGGKVWAQGAVEQGATFSFTLEQGRSA